MKLYVQKSIIEGLSKLSDETLKNFVSVVYDNKKKLQIITPVDELALKYSKKYYGDKALKHIKRVRLKEVIKGSSKISVCVV